MDIVAMSGTELYQSVKGAADLDVVNNLPDVDEKDSRDYAQIDDGGTVTENVLQGGAVDIYV